MVEQDLAANQRASAGRTGFVLEHLKTSVGKDCLARDITFDQVEGYKTRRLAAKAKPATVNWD